MVQGVGVGELAMTPVPVTLSAAAAAAAVNFWLGWRIAEYREKFKVSVGDGGQEPLLRRMRAQSNFIENAPLFLIMLGALELSGANRWGLAAIATVFVLARVSHAYGMDSAEMRRWRVLGMMGTALPNLALILWALWCVVRSCL
jgi:uncharacterized membrane protein YecN with MAPEG domain